MKDVWDKTRREILDLLRKRPHTAGEISDQFDLAAATVSHHLSVLRESGLVKSDRRAQTIIYSVNLELFRRLVAGLTEFIES